MTTPVVLPALVGRQFVQKRSTSFTASVPPPVPGAADIRRGLHVHPTAAIPAPTVSTGLVKIISAHWHYRGSAAMTAPAVESAPVVGYTAAGVATLPPPHRARAKARRSFLVLQTPAIARDYRFEPTSLLWYFHEEAESIARIYGEWVAKFIPVPDEEPGLDKFYRGGHRHYITPDEASELTAAGFGDFIRTEVLK